jgi:hypothetical protein
MIRLKRSLWLPVSLAATVLASTASANSRFPRAERLIENPADSNKLYLAATYGLMVTSDRGMNWYHVCEAAFSFQTGYTGDPVVMLTGAGSLLASSQSSLQVSTDEGCDWKQTLMGPASPKQTYFDFTISPSAGHTIITVSTSYETAGPVNTLQESTDNGLTWKAVGTPLPVVVLNTVDVDPTNPAHVFATGLTTADDTPDSGVFLESMDNGMTWMKYSIPGTFAWASPYIAAVLPTDPKKIFVRTDGWKNRQDVETADDALLYSSDGGHTWKEILHAGGPADDSPGAKLFGFALSPDGSTVLAGYGDPVDGSRLVESSWFGVYKSSTDGMFSFGADPTNPTAMMPGESISCITWTKNGIYVCGVPQGESSFVAFAKDPTFKARADMTILMKLNETRGIPPNCTRRAATTCNWSADCVNLNACPDAGTMSGTTGGGGSTGGGGGSTTTMGTSGGFGGAGGTTTTTSGGGGATGTGGSDQKPKACSCRAPGAATSGGAAAMGWLFGAMLLRNRRRSRAKTDRKVDRNA